jgi:hypothetical protein
MIELYWKWETIAFDTELVLEGKNKNENEIDHEFIQEHVINSFLNDMKRSF